MRVALTGASGFTGRPVQQALRAAGIDSVALAADLTDSGAVDVEIAATEFDVLLHLAGHAFIDVADWRNFYSTNQLGTLTLLDAVARHRPGSRCILASTAQVYGPQAAGLVAESLTPNPTNHYAISKYAMELGAARWSDRLELIIARPFNYTGVGQSVQYVIPKIVDAFRRREPRLRLGNIHVKRDFGDVRAVAKAYAGLVQARAIKSPVNICSGEVHSITDVLDLARALTGHEPEVEIDPALVRQGDVPTLGGDNARLRALLPDWSPYPLAQTLEWMVSD